MEKSFILMSNKDEEILKIALQRPQKGNFFFPGAGFDGPYIDEFEKIMKKLGFSNVHCERADSPNSSGNMFIDVALGDSTNMMFEYNFIDHLGSYPSSGPQLNLIGYSYGGVIAGAAAYGYTNVTEFCVDNLVLIATPIYRENLELLQKNKRVKNIIIHNLMDKDDIVYAGIERLEMIAKSPAVVYNAITAYGEGHFYYAKEGIEGDKRRRELLGWLKSQGLK